VVVTDKNPPVGIDPAEHRPCLRLLAGRQGQLWRRPAFRGAPTCRGARRPGSGSGQQELPGSRRPFPPRGGGHRPGPVPR